MAYPEDSPRAYEHDLADLQDDFPDYRIFTEVTGERVRLVAVRRHHGTSPHTVVAADAAELRAVLTGSVPTGP
jgi:hypothetical protein